MNFNHLKQPLYHLLCVWCDGGVFFDGERIDLNQSVVLLYDEQFENTKTNLKTIEFLLVASKKPVVIILPF